MDTGQAGDDPYAAAERVFADLLALLCGTTGSASACVAEVVGAGGDAGLRVLTVYGPGFRREGPDPRMTPVARHGEPVVAPAFLGLPLRKADRLVGVVGMTDCPEGYDEGLVADLAPLAETCASLVVSCRDVRRLHRAEVQRRLSAESRLGRERRLLESIVDNTTAVVFVKDREGRYLLVNEQYERVVGLTRDQVLGRRDTDVLATGPANAVMANDHEVLAHGAPLQFEEVVPREGEPRTYLSVKFPLRDPDGEPFAVGGIATDITDRLRAEERGSMLAALVEQSADFVGVADLTGACLFVNDAGAVLVGLDRPVEELTIRDFVHPSDWPRHEREVLAGLRERGTWVGDAVFRHLGTGEPIPVDFRVFTVDPHRGRDPLVGCVARDLRAQRRAEREREVLEAQLHQAQRLESVGRLAGGVAHDFNNLLTVIVAYAEMLLPEIGDQDLHDEVEQIHSAAQRASALTRQLLLFSRRGMSDPRPVRPTRVLQGLEDLLRRTLGEDVALTTHYATDATVEIDPAALEQVVVNLAVNARDAMPAGGGLTIRTRPGESPGTVEIVVVDTGEGMSPDVAAQAFEPFFTTKHPDRGTGLGLATVHGIVEQAGGSVRLDSRPGEGTSVRVALPVVTAVRRGEPEPGPTVAATVPGEGETVLVVEDEASVRRLTERVLTGHGYRVVTASGPEEAVALAARADLTLDLMLTDMVMPGMTGTQVVDAVRRDRPGLPVVFMSGYARAVVGENLPPGTTLLGKPFSVAALLGVVRHTLAGPAAR